MENCKICSLHQISCWSHKGRWDVWSR